MIAGLYVPSESPLHRLDVGVKLLVLMALGIGLILTKSVLLLILVVAVTGLLFAFAAELGLMRLWQTTRPLLIWFVFIAVAQILVANAETAGLIVLRLAVLVWAAALVTYHDAPVRHDGMPYPHNRLAESTWCATTPRSVHDCSDHKADTRAE